MARDKIDHDALFKELLQLFFVEFLERFVSRLAEVIDADSIHFEPVELFDPETRKKHVADLVATARLAGATSKSNRTKAMLVIHLEHQSTPAANMLGRMLEYWRGLYLRYQLPIYPIVICSYDKPKRPEPDELDLRLADRGLWFSYERVQLNRLDWRDFVAEPNPAAAALMAKMNVAERDRVRVKVECCRMAATLTTDPKKLRVLFGFVDAYLRLNATQAARFQERLEATLPSERKEQVMAHMTSWEERGLKRGLRQGRKEGRDEGRDEGRAEGRDEGRLEGVRLTVQRLLIRRFGELDDASSNQIDALNLAQLERLGDALLDFKMPDDLRDWLHAEQG